MLFLMFYLSTNLTYTSVYIVINRIFIGVLYVSSSLAILVQLLTKKGLVYSPFVKFKYNKGYFCQLYVRIPVFLITILLFAFRF